jgi:DNA-binding NtrC family response regulator
VTLEKEAKIAMERRTKSVLVVEDDHDLRHMLSLRLLSAGYIVYGAENGIEALEEMVKHPVDVVLTDYRMPKMDGLELLSISCAWWPRTPVVVLSGEHDDLAREAVERGAFAWVCKGSESTTIMEIVASAVQQSVHA